jgi:hypothetical protein
MLDGADLKKVIIKALEQNFDLHLHRIDDASLEIHSVEEINSEEIHIELSYREVLIRCCAGPSWDSKQTRKLRLIRQNNTWVDALLRDT